MKNVLIEFFIFFILSTIFTTVASAEECWDCDSKCCTDKLGFKVCEPACQSGCSLHNLTCGKVEIPIIPGGPTVEIPKDSVPILTTLLTGGMVNPVTQKATNDAIQNLAKAIKDIDNTNKKALDDTKKEVDRAGRNIDEAGQAIGEYLDTKAKGTVNSVNSALDRVREGKVVDALWHMSTDSYKNESDASAAAATKSSLINTVGTLAASTYGGPGGAAAYASWLTYYQSGGDVNLALKVGVLAGASSWALAETGKLPTRDASGQIIASDLAKKTAITGAIGGLAVAAAGGDESAIRDGFIGGGGMVLIQEGYHSVTKNSLNDKKSLGESKGDPYCTSTSVNCRNIPKDAVVKDPNTGEVLGLDQTKLDNTAPHVGTMAPLDPNAKIMWHSEASPGMVVVSKIPGMNAMAVFHDQWGLNWKMPSAVLVPTIVPAIVLTYNGTSAPLLEQVRKVSQSNLQKMTNIEQNSPMTPVIYQDSTEAVPIKNEQIETAYTCVKDNDTRSISIEVDTAKKNFACRVIYRSNLTRKIPWRAINDINYCEIKAKTLVKSQIDWGYSCIVGMATARM